MTLGAYALRRTVGALCVLLLMTWLIQFAVSHFDAPPRNADCIRCVPPAIEERLRETIFPISAFQPDLSHGWNVAASIVGGAILLGIAISVVARAR